MTVASRVAIDVFDSTSYVAIAQRVGWPRGMPRGKSGLHKVMVPGNSRPGRLEGKRHRKQTASVRGGKGETVR